MNPFDNVKALYNKTRLDLVSVDDGFCIFLNKWLAFDTKTAKIVKPLLTYLFFIKPEHYIMLLYFAIPQSRPPYLKKPPKADKEKENPLLAKTQYILTWTNREVKKNGIILAHILKDEKYWKTQLGVK